MIWDFFKRIFSRKKKEAIKEEVVMVEPKYSLGEKQRKFVYKVSLLIQFAYKKGYELSFAEAYRPAEMAKLYAKKWSGISKSLHTSRLAIDLNLFKDGKFLRKSGDHKELGEYWENLAEPGLKTCWGGRFSKPDGNHYSIEHNGRK